MKILPCPFCGAVPDYDSPSSFTQETQPKWGALTCDCGAVGPDVRAVYSYDFRTWRDAAVEAWNKRVPEGAK